jgi:transposase
MYRTLLRLVPFLAILAILQAWPPVARARLAPGISQEASGEAGMPVARAEATADAETQAVVVTLPEPTVTHGAVRPTAPPVALPQEAAARPSQLATSPAEGDSAPAAATVTQMVGAAETLPVLPTPTPLAGSAAAAGPYQAGGSSGATALLAQWPPQIEVLSQPAFAIPGAVVPVGALISGTLPVESVVVEYDLQRLSWPNGRGARTPPLPGVTGLNLLQWVAPLPRQVSDLLWYRVVAEPGRDLPPLHSADQCLPYGRWLNAGAAEAFPDGEGRLWEADRAYYPGSYGYDGPTRVLTSSEAVQGATGYGEQDLYWQQRASVDGVPFHYRFWYGSGLYEARLEVELRFAELEASGPGQRVFDVLADGQPLIEGLDLYATAGPRAALVVTREVTVTYQAGKDPVLDLAFVPRVGEACVAGVAVRGVESVPQYAVSIAVDHPADDVYAVVGERSQRHEPFVRLGRYTDGSECAAGFLFRRVPVPGQAYVSSAWMELSGYPLVGRQHGDVDVTVYAQATDSAPGFGRRQQIVTVRPLTSAGVRWLIDRPWSAGETCRSPDLSAALQELFDRPNWRPGNNVAILIMPNGGAVGWRDVVAQEWAAGGYGPGPAATLRITYVPPLAGQPGR